MTDDVLSSYINTCCIQVEQALDHWLPNAQLPPSGLHTAMRYAVLGGGKRIRPVLVYATGAALGVSNNRLDGPACAIELIHAYSLVHDDLPAMDDDNLRRGRPTCHKAFDEATAILVGDALQALAFYILAKDQTMQVTPAVRLQMLTWLAQAVGSRGLVGGQALDLAAEGQEITGVELENIHIHKTGALIRSCVRLATILSESADDSKPAKALDRYAKYIGLAFQVQDDILDIIGNTSTLGKTSGKDQHQNKATYPSLLGLDAAREKAYVLCQQALDAIEDLNSFADPLRHLAHYIISRTN
ncbi:geranyl transferase [Achromatium sp. WMS1]|nr:geranyl transferase [Achromatium sp. WMS1]